MRTPALVAMLALALTPAAASTAPSLVAHAFDADATLLTWDPAPGDVVYAVYRGPSFDALELLGRVRTPFFLDDAPAPGTYVVEWGELPEGFEYHESSGGAGCVRVYGSLRFSINVQNCLAR